MHLPPAESHRGSGLHRCGPRVKLVAALVLVTLTVLLPRRPDPLYLIPACIVLTLWALGRMPLKFALKRLLVAEFFILGFVLLALLSPASWPIVLSAVVKSNLCVLTMLLLSWTTPFHEITQQLQQLRFPRVMLTTLTLMYRYFPVLAEESTRMQRARASRTFTSKRRLAWQTVATIIGQLFIRTAGRAERIYLAMCARGWK